MGNQKSNISVLEDEKNYICLLDCLPFIQRIAACVQKQNRQSCNAQDNFKSLH